MGWVDGVVAVGAPVPDGGATVPLYVPLVDPEVVVLGLMGGVDVVVLVGPVADGFVGGAPGADGVPGVVVCAEAYATGAAHNATTQVACNSFERIVESLLVTNWKRALRRARSAGPMKIRGQPCHPRMFQALEEACLHRVCTARWLHRFDLALRQTRPDHARAFIIAQLRRGDRDRFVRARCCLQRDIHL